MTLSTVKFTIKVHKQQEMPQYCSVYADYSGVLWCSAFSRILRNHQQPTRHATSNDHFV